MKNSRRIAIIDNRNKIIIGLASLALLVLMLSILFHITPLGMIVIVADFATHHYFLVGFFALLAFFVGMKFYFSNTEEIKGLINQKNNFLMLKTMLAI